MSTAEAIEKCGHSLFGISLFALESSFFGSRDPPSPKLSSELSLQGLPQEQLHFGICSLGKVPVKNANCIERFRHHCANNDCVNLVLKRIADRALAHRNCDYDLSGILLA